MGSHDPPESSVEEQEPVVINHIRYRVDRPFYYGNN